jgi:phosphatidylglycerol:prolipoprotein diacylglycerol transferase
VFPILVPIEVGGQDFSLHTYGVMMALAFVTGIWLGVREARRTGQDPEDIMDISFWVLIAAMVGARVLFIIVNADEYYYACADFAYFNATYDPPVPLDGPHCFEIAKVWTGGLVFYGGFLGAVAASVWYCRKQGLSFLRIADTLIPSVALGQTFGRLGCLAAGCCWGKVCSLPFGIHLPAHSMAWKGQVDVGLIDKWAETTAAIHPTQLYEAIATLFIFGLLIWYRRRKRYHGQVLLMYLFVYPLARSTIEVFRGDKARGMVAEWGSDAVNTFLGLPLGSNVLLSTSQLISLLVAAGAVWLLLTVRKGSSTADASPTTPATT